MLYNHWLQSEVTSLFLNQALVVVSTHAEINDNHKENGGFIPFWSRTYNKKSQMNWNMSRDTKSISGKGYHTRYATKVFDLKGRSYLSVSVNLQVNFILFIFSSFS